MRISVLFAVTLLALPGLCAQEKALFPVQTIAEDADGRTLALPSPEESQIAVSEIDGRWTLRLRVASEGAAGQQLFLENLRLPEGATLNVRELDANGEPGPVVAAYAGVGPLNGEPFWTATVPGAAALVEIQFAGEVSGGLPFQLTRALALSAEGLAKAAPALPEPVSQFEGARGFARFRGNVVPFEIRDGVAIYDNDIILGQPHEIDLVSPKDVDSERQSQGITSTSYRWPGGVIPYVIDATMPNQYRVTDAVNHWNTKLSGIIRLVPRTSETHYVRFARPASSTTCNSYIGYIRMAAQPINIGDSCSTGNAIHEIGHAVGLYHEHTREDRNSFVKINFANITSTATSNFDQAISASDDLGNYDYGSIMHYGAYAFSANGLPTIETIPSGISIGQRSTLSAGDIAGVQTMYPTTTTTTPLAPTTVGVTVASNPAGQPLVVDGVSISATTTFQWTPGSSHTVSAPNSSTSTTKYAFKSWSDGGAQTHTVTTPTSALNLTANYQKQFNVKAASSNTSVGTASLSPTSSDSFYNEGSALSATATATGSACFTGWSGITAPAASRITINVNQAYSVTANFQSGAISAAPSSFAFGVAASTGSVSVSASTGCAWSARSNASWIKITSGASGTGNGVVAFSVTKRTGKSGRTGTLTVGGNTITVVQ
jgi:astacin